MTRLAVVERIGNIENRKRGRLRHCHAVLAQQVHGAGNGPAIVRPQAGLLGGEGKSGVTRERKKRRLIDGRPLESVTTG